MSVLEDSKAWLCWQRKICPDMVSSIEAKKLVDNLIKELSQTQKELQGYKEVVEAADEVCLCINALVEPNWESIKRLKATLSNLSKGDSTNEG